MSNATDERRGVPSASAMERLINCPPSHAMCAVLPPEDDSPEAASGTRIHAVLAGLAEEATLTADEAQTLEMCREQAGQLMETWLADARATKDDAHAWVAERERRLGMTIMCRVLAVTPKAQADFVMTGQPDVVITDTFRRALVVDYKTGRGDVADAVDNAQLAALAVLVARFYKCDSVRVAIVAPWQGKPTVADYDWDAVNTAQEWLWQALNAAEEATPADAVAGDWCKYCRAKVHCEAFRSAQLAKVEVLQPDNLASKDGEAQRAALFAGAMELPAAKLADLVRGLAMVERFVGAIKGAAKERAANDAEFQRFYQLKEKSGRRSIADVGKVYAACHGKGVTADAFTALCSISLGDVKELLKAATGAKGKALDALHDEVLQGAVETGKGSVELVPVEGRLA